MNQTHPVAANVAPVGPVSGMYMMPAQEQSTNSTPKRILQVRGIKGLSIAMLVLSCLLGILGIIGVIIEARRSYMGTPIWSGLGVLLITSVLGLLVYYKRFSRCINVAFIVMTVVSAVWQFGLGLFMCYNVGPDSYYRSCNPHVDYDSYRWDDDNICQFPNYARITVDITIVLLAFASMIICIILFGLTTYATFSCCHNCCRKRSPEYMPYSSVMMVPMGIPNNQGLVLHHSTTPGQLVGAGSVPQTTNAQPTMIAGSPFQSAVAQPVVIAGSTPQSTSSQPVVVGHSPQQLQTVPQQGAVVGSPPQLTFPQPVVFAGSPHQSTVSQPVVVGGLTHQVPIGQQVIFAGSVPQTSHAQPLVVAGATSAQPAVNVGTTPSPIADANAVQKSVTATANDTPNEGTQAAGAAGGQVVNQPQNWEKF